jgi:hypothetical protein
MLKNESNNVFSELVKYARVHFMVKRELDLLRKGKVGNKESTALLLFAVIMESQQEDLIHVMMQEGASEIIRNLIRDYPSLGRKFPILAQYTNAF